MIDNGKDFNLIPVGVGGGGAGLTAAQTTKLNEAITSDLVYDAETSVDRTITAAEVASSSETFGLNVKTASTITLDGAIADGSEITISHNAATGSVIVVGGGNIDGDPTGIDINIPSTVNLKKTGGNWEVVSKASFGGSGGGTTAASIGLGNVDNTADADKPISTAQQTALNGFVTKTGTSLITGVLSNSHGSGYQATALNNGVGYYRAGSVALNQNATVDAWSYVQFYGNGASPTALTGMIRKRAAGMLEIINYGTSQIEIVSGGVIDLKPTSEARVKGSKILTAADSASFVGSAGTLTVATANALTTGPDGQQAFISNQNGGGAPAYLRAGVWRLVSNDQPIAV